MKKKVLCFVLCSMLLFLSVGCGKHNETIATTKAEEKILEVSAEFINKIEKEDYENLKDYIFLPEHSFVTDADIKWFLPRTQMADLIGKRTDVVPLEFSDGNVPSGASETDTVAKTIIYQAENADDAYELLYVLDKNNEWKLYLENFLVEEFTFVADRNLNIKVNGIDIDSSYIEEEYTGSNAPSKNSVVYKLQNVPNRELPITIQQGKYSKTIRVNVKEQDVILQ